MVSLQASEPLEEGHAFADLSSYRVTEVTGSEAQAWLNDLVSADVGSLESGRSQRSLLLARTGGVLAEFTVARSPDALYLIQDPAQPGEIGRLLAPYMLSSDVDLRDRTGRLAILAFPGATAVPALDGTSSWSPSILGPGIDLVGRSEDRDRLAAALEPGYTPAADDALETWRIVRGIAKPGVDSQKGDLPQECGLEDAVSFDKGCFVGQEAVAKARNLGHPRRELLRLEADGPVVTGERVRTDDGNDAGAVTSVAALNGRHVLLARVAWRDRDAILRTASGAPLRARSNA
jgi:tRNA-modifying protein YgfZ